MNTTLDPMEKFNFFMGKWNLEYKIPETTFSKADEGQGIGEVSHILNGKFVKFEYQAETKYTKTSAYGIFGWDKNSNIYKFWWFEDSGNFMSASANFIDPDTLYLNWHNSTLIQTFSRIKDQIILTMKFPINKDEFIIVLEVTFKKEANQI